MAFDMPLEADQPGESTFFLSFVTTPVVGTLMWILGGDTEDNSTGEEKNEELSQNNDNEDNDFNITNVKSDQISDNTKERSSIISGAMSKNIPELTESVMSSLCEEGDVSYSADEWKCLAENQECSDRIRHECVQRDIKVRRKTSWSDESGQSLTEYFDEKSYHEPMSDAQPRKSAMKKSKHQFIPSGITGPTGGMIMPSGGGLKIPSGVNGNGGVSPQWGWYISTTPPAGDKFPNTKKTGKELKEKKITTYDQQCPLLTNESSIYCKSTSNTPMPIFTKGLKGAGRTNMAEYPSILL